jgi:predicted cobalt transporter CbtA
MADGPRLVNPNLVTFEGQPSLMEAAATSNPRPQVLRRVLGGAPDLLVSTYPQVPDDTKPDLADHQFSVSSACSSAVCWNL